MFYLIFSFLLFLLIRSYTIGAAVNTDEYVPTPMPKSIAKANPRSISPPKIQMISNTNMVESEVFMVRPKVLLIAEFYSSFSGRLGYRVTHSRIRSKMITVSLMEYPITVRIAAINCWSISIEKGAIFHISEYKPMRMRES